MKTILQATKRGLVTIYAIGSDLYMDYNAMYIDDLCDVFDMWQPDAGKTIKEFAMELFKQEVHDVECMLVELKQIKTIEAPMQIKMGEGTLNSRRKMVVHLENEVEAVLLNAREEYLSDPSGFVSRMKVESKRQFKNEYLTQVAL